MSAGVGDISVVIPYYNRERYVDEAIQSVLSQTLRPLEIIIVNDASRASSRTHLDSYASVCRIVDLPVNVGLAGARNAGIRAARGKYIAFLDDDDIWLPRKLEVQYDYMHKHPECAVVHTAVWAFFSDRPDTLWIREWSAPMTLAEALTDSGWAIPSSLLVRAEVARTVWFDANFRECEDRDFIIRCCAVGYRIEGIREPLVRFRRQGHASLTKSRRRMLRIDLKLFWKHRKHYNRAYGPRGFVSFMLEKLWIASQDSRYMRRAVRFLVRFIKVKYHTRNSYREPVRVGDVRRPPLPGAGTI